jgi:kynurenine 3-monooxygenase
MSRKIGIIGSGLVGSLQAILMAKRGYTVEVFERRSDLRTAKLYAGKSINLALSPRGWKALEIAGIAEDIKAISIPMHGRQMHAIDGTLTYQPYGLDGESIYSVSRGDLNKRLMTLADDFSNIKYHFDEICEDIDLEKNTVNFKNALTDVKSHASFDHVFATDGAYSAVRQRMQKQQMFNYSQTYLTHGYKELVIPAGPNGTHHLDKNCLHIWPRGEFMMIALANQDGSFTVTLFFPMEGPISFASLTTEAQVKEFFEKTFADALPIMPSYLTDYFNNPTSTLVTVQCAPWNFQDKALLFGDAAHAMVPFYGQGMNCGFEDCTVFSEMLDNAGEDWGKLFPAYSAQRVPDTNAMQQLALDNYIEMRGLTADPDFLLRKKIEAKFTKLYPNKWLPLYSQVTFSHIRYSEAYANGQRQKHIMDYVMKMNDIHTAWDADSVMNKILDYVD